MVLFELLEHIVLQFVCPLLLRCVAQRMRFWPMFVVRQLLGSSNEVYIHQLAIEKGIPGIPNLSVTSVAPEHSLYEVEIDYYNKGDMLLYLEPLNLQMEAQNERLFGMPIQELLPFTKRLCETIVGLHRNQIVHRDIKPENIFINKIISFH